MRRALALLAIVLAGACAKTEAPNPRAGGDAGACASVRETADEGAEHISPPATGSYKIDPPTSGRHYPSPAAAGISTTPIANEVQVHNLEHGHVVVQYDGLTADQVKDVEFAVTADPRMIVLAPRPRLGRALALTAWRRIQTCDRFPTEVAAVIREFVKNNRDKAPESVP